MAAMTASRRLIGLAGCGRWGRHIVRDLIELGCEVIVADPSDDVRREAREGGAAGVVARVADLPAIDGAVVATPTRTHAAIVEALLAREIPIFCEKPLTADQASASLLAAMAPDHLFVMDKWRYHPGVEMLARIARAGELGPVRGLRTTRVGEASRHDVDPIWALAPHDLSIALEILGRLPEPRRAVPAAATGLIAMLGDDPWMVFEVSGLNQTRRREVQLHCRDGLAVLTDAFSDHVRVIRADGGSEHRPISAELPLSRELRAFLDHLDGGPAPRSSAREGADIVHAIARLRALAGIGEESP
jgi:predicted dehydrogenase